jgi:hypothetical protein
MCNEHLKDISQTLKGVWTNLFSECLKPDKIPAVWRLATLKVLYKGKGEVSDPHAYRGIALECTAFKLLSSILTKRLYMMTETALPDEQFGFQRGRSTLQAASCQKEDIEEALRHPRGKLHATFIDYTKAFDLINRTLLIEKLEEKLGRNSITKLLRNILGKKFYSNRRHYSQITTLMTDEQGTPRRPPQPATADNSHCRYYKSITE